MTPELLAIASGTLAFAAAVSGFLLGRSHGRADGYKRGLHIGAVSWKATASRLAEEWANRPEWPLNNRTNVQRWMELGRRESIANCLDAMCKRFQITMPQRKTNRSNDE